MPDMSRQGCFVDDFAAEKGAVLQEYFVYFKKPQRIYVVKAAQSAAGGSWRDRRKEQRPEPKAQGEQIVRVST